LNFLSREGREGGEVRRTGIFVEIRINKSNSSVRSDMVAVRNDYAAPTGLKIILVLDSTNMPRRRRWGRTPCQNHFALDVWGIWRLNPIK
jgi:hypothetical protein